MHSTTTTITTITTTNKTEIAVLKNNSSFNKISWTNCTKLLPFIISQEQDL
jgi:hypothetical protein